jgi:hypothetical protein
MEPVEVIARFDDQGRLTPLSFTWQGRSFPVDSTGRRWQDPHRAGVRAGL